MTEPQDDGWWDQFVDGEREEWRRAVRAALDASGLADTQKQIVELTAALELTKSSKDDALATATAKIEALRESRDFFAIRQSDFTIELFKLQGTRQDERDALRKQLREAIEALSEMLTYVDSGQLQSVWPTVMNARAVLARIKRVLP